MIEYGSLVYKSGIYGGLKVMVGDLVESRGDVFEVTGWEEPLHRASSGRVHVKDDQGNHRTYFPHVFDMEFPTEDL